MQSSALRTRWAAIGAAVAVTLGAGGVGLVAATSPSGAVAYVPITPCRAADTRPAPDTVGLRSTPIGAAETHVVNRNDGGCVGVVPNAATGLQLNVTATGASAASFITIWASGPLPLASSLNPTPGQPPVPNAVTTSITGAGNFNIYNNVGTVNVIVDIVGYYTDHNHDDRYYQKSEADALLEGRVADPTVVRNTVNIPAGGETGFNFFAICPSGLRATGGGVGAANGGSPNDRVLFSGPTDSTGNFTNTVTGDVPVRWAGRYLNGAASPVDVYVWAICG